MLNFALIGAGNQGKNHARFIAEHPQARLVAVCDMMRDKAEAVAVRHGVPAYDDVANMLAAV